MCYLYDQNNHIRKVRTADTQRVHKQRDIPCHVCICWDPVCADLPILTTALEGRLTCIRQDTVLQMVRLVSSPCSLLQFRRAIVGAAGNGQTVAVRLTTAVLDRTLHVVCYHFGGTPSSSASVPSPPAPLESVCRYDITI